MSFVPIHAAIAAAHAAKKRMREEEKMAGYSPEDLDGWEFKMVRAQTRKFRTTEQIEKVRMEEAQTGWEMVEKFDDYRLRFKRRIERRSMDAHSQSDPYRTTVGSNTGLWVGLSLGLAGVFALAASFFAQGGFIKVEQPWTLVTVLFLLVLFIGVILAKKSR